MSDLRRRLKQALTTAMKARDSVAVPALRSALAAIDNAEAVTPDAASSRGLAIEESPVGVGATEIARRVLTEAEVADIVRADVSERESAALDYDRAGQAERAQVLRAQARLLLSHLT